MKDYDPFSRMDSGAPIKKAKELMVNLSLVFRLLGKLLKKGKRDERKIIDDGV